MAIDGSFSLESAFKRFLARCPELASLPQFETLAEKGHKVTEEQVLNSVAELFLHPKYTIPLVGCFRPIVRKLVDKAVALLQQLVPNLRSNLDVIVAESDLNLHELACLAFCRTLDLAPFSLGPVLTYFKCAPPPFECILMKDTIPELPAKDLARYLHAVRTSYRLLVMEPEVFAKLWDWSFFLDLVKKFVEINPGNDTEFQKVIADIRWCGIQILSIILKMSDRAIKNFGVGAEEAFSCLLRWEEFCQDTAIEKAGSYIVSLEHVKLGSVNGDIEFNQEKCLQSFVIDSQTLPQFHETKPSIKRRRLATWDDKLSCSTFVITSTVKKSFQMVLLAVSQKWPILLYGPAGAGKSALISKLAQDSGNQVLSIHMDDQIDGKTLIGSYVFTKEPGVFRWQPGSLIQAVLNGFWVVFEDIDKAPSDVLSILLPLLEGASSFVTGHGEEIRVAESFRLFSTISTAKCNLSCGTEGGNLLGVLWRKVMIGPPSNDDLLSIVKAWYPNLEPLAGKLIETFQNVNSAPLQFEEIQSGNSASFNSFSRFSLRDLLKWCKRIAGLRFSSMGDGLSANERHYIYQEAVDIFAAFFSSAENQLTIMKDIAKMWAVPVLEAETISPYKPIIQDLFSELRIGRVTLQRTETTLCDQKRFVQIRSSLHVLERIACSVKYNEPVLLVGETGTGKTTLVQNLARWLSQRLTVLNLSQQTDVADLVGGYKPVDAQSICIPLYKEFEDLFSKTFSYKANAKLFGRVQEYLCTKNWKKLLRGFKDAVDFYQNKLEKDRAVSAEKRKKPLDEEEKRKAWENFSVKVDNARRQIGGSFGMVFSFIEGAFVTALRNGEWILLDEVNLAPPETLQRVIGVLEGENGSLCLAERGDVNHVHRHPNFRIFACMNPATDAGKHDLPYSLRSRFTEYYVHDVLDDADLNLFIEKFMEESRSNKGLLDNIREFYKAAKRGSEERLLDGANQKPQFSLRSIYRALEYIRHAKGKFGFQRAIYDGFSMFFLTLLDRPSAKIMNGMILHYLLEKMKFVGNDLLQREKFEPLPFNCYLGVEESSRSVYFLKNYVLTKSVMEHLSNLARAIFIRRYPVLLQGPTSSGKTSLVQYLAAINGREFVRINNHEHTDLQEYLGSYITDASGKLVYHEGVLVKAVRNGHWIVLDELNLAPSDVMEALNRLLDDNRELFVPELRETIRAHPDFMLFATQNPPTFYGGRKMLSRAFRNRFVEIHVDEIPADELSTILKNRCEIPESYAKKMVKIMEELQLHRQSSKVFAGKHGFITPRDLFRWADRFRAFGRTHEDLARDGYYLLAERLRDEGDKCVVQKVLEGYLPVKLVKDNLYNQVPAGSATDLESLGNVIWTKSMRRLYFLVKRCYELREPVLLIGETGGGKTAVCQLLSIVLGAKLHILNCHQYTETSDFLGGFYPIRERSKLISEYKYLIEQLMLSKAFIHYPGIFTISSDIGQASSTLDQLADVINRYRQDMISCPDVTVHDLDAFDQMKLELAQLHQKWQMIFMWQDGPLIEAMKAGDLFLMDEISLADDSVLERLNSVLEPERKLSLAEKGGPVLETITAHRNFFVLATMNPGGDYGKKELSPALRNRFTEIWVPPVSDLDELKSIALERFSGEKHTHIVDVMINFWDWFNQLQTGRMLTIRDLLSWVSFIKFTERSLGLEFSFIHGAFLVVLDGLNLGTGISKRDASELRERCLSFLLEQLEVDNVGVVSSKLETMESYGWGDLLISTNISCSNRMQRDKIFGIDPFYIEKGYEKCEVGGFELFAPTTCRNALRVLRALQLPKPVLLEGSPGVGKTSLIVSLGKFSGHKVVRINLSEQTDIMDLLGSDLPVESDEGMEFAWSDGILLQALKEGCWVLLDELNLAPQSVLEGLNAILDHRAEVFIPELGLTFRCPSSFRVFACQNPSYQGGGRKGLPKSFLNRFTKVYVDELVENDYLIICRSLFPSIPEPVLSKLILFNKRLHEETMLYHKFAQDGSPWEFNLRDVIRSCQIIQGAPDKSKVDCFLNLVYVQRMRTAADRREVVELYEKIFGVKPFINPYPRVQFNSQYLIVGNNAIKRSCFQSSKISNSQLKIMPGIRHSMEAAAECIRHEWLCILIGPPSSGKTSLIRLLAQLTGNALNELNLSSATDISELLGCFEQYDAFRKFRLTVAQVESYFSEYCSLQLESSVESVFSERKDLTTKWLGFLSSSSTLVENWKSTVNTLPLLVEIIEYLKLELEKDILPVSWSSKELNSTMKAILKLQESQQGRPYSAKFEWVTGLLIKAIENGEWIVLENANLCNPTVLDRINSLVEPCGTITVNECGIVDGKPVVLHPHSNFRMFLTVNPCYGEVSRAMRNRGVEIYIMEPYWLLDKGSGNSCKEIQLKDVQSFLVLSGIPIDKLVNSMAKAHIYARDEGLRLNVHITYLELARWVQLFQQLLMNGNQPMWSILISWEHTYLSSLGEAEGRNIISHAYIAYLSVNKLSESDLLPGSSLCLPGGWPKPLKLRDFIWYSKEASVKQNCMYLEFLGAQYASHSHPLYPAVIASGYARTYLINTKMLYDLMFPEVSSGMILNSGTETEFNWDLANKELYFAAIWTIEQATESNLDLYRSWFSWFSSQLHSYSPFSSSFLTFKQVLDHEIWKSIISYHRKLLSLQQVDVSLLPIPLVSLELVDFAASDDKSRSSNQPNVAVKCLSLLILSFKQWNDESGHKRSSEARHFKPFLSSLQNLENKVLEMILSFLKRSEKEVLETLVVSPLFDKLIELYSDLLEDHMQFWKGVTSSQFEHLLFSCRNLLKDAKRLQDICPEEVEKILMESKNLGEVSSWNFSSDKSLLWVHGGYPFLPSSAVLYYKHLQLLKLCELIWPMKTQFSKHGNRSLIEVVASSNPELRLLAMQGNFMSSYILSKCDEDDGHVVHQLEEMYQMLLGRFENEKRKLEANLGSDEDAIFEATSACCCVVCPEMLCRKSCFDSWQDTLPIIDSESLFLDMELLQELLDPNKLETVLTGISNPLKFALKFSLTFSSRPPQMFLPHQKILWTVEAQMLVDAASAKITSYVHEMWFSWNLSLWSCSPDAVKSFSKIDGYDIPLPDMLLQPVKTATVAQILQSTNAIKDHSVYCLKLKIASSNLWQDCSARMNLPDFLLSVARCLFQQIIYAHKKSFGEDNFAEIQSFLCFSEKSSITRVSSLIESTSHQKLNSSMHMFIEPLLRDLYFYRSSNDLHHNLGCTWLRIGALRYSLLLSCDDLDPAMKYSCKYSQLEEKISTLELEIKVRQECEHLAGRLFDREVDIKRALALEQLQDARNLLKRKIVYRPDPKKFKKLKDECAEFLELISSLIVLVGNIEVMDLQQIVDQVCNWQATATCFNNRLSDEYIAYIDIVQPVQVAVYEMKLGLSLVVSSVLEKNILNAVGEDNMDRVMESIYSFMRFPRGCEFKFISVNPKSRLPEFSSHNIGISTNFGALDMSLLEKLVAVSSDVSAERKASVLQLKAAVHQNILVRVAHHVANAQLMDNASFMILDKIFNEFASIWMNMKVQVKTKEHSEAQQFKFMPRVFKIESILEVDISTLAKSVSFDSFLEWQELLSGEEFTERMETSEKDKSLEEEWNLMQESFLNNMVYMHNQLFGSMNLVTTPGAFEISDADRLLSFTVSYSLGVRMIKGLRGLYSSILDAKLVPEHLLCLCLEHEQQFVSPHKSARKYNFYKNSNAPVMAKMVKLLATLKQRIISLLREWEDHPSLQKILDVIEMLLAIPLGTPIAKALSGLQFLLYKSNELQENGSRFTLSDQLKPVVDLVCSWQKMEFHSWPALLDDVQDQFEINAAKLWFPLFSVLQRRDSADIVEYDHSTLRSLEEFIQTSSIGEFKKRLQLLLAFYGQIVTGRHLGTYSSSCQEANVNILYNVFGYYVQFLPIILEHIEVNRKNIEVELKDHLKICQWDHFESIEYSKRSRQKLRKLIQKYTDVLQQPVVLILFQEAEKKGMAVQYSQGPQLLIDFSDKDVGMLNGALDLSQFKDEDRSAIRYADWRKTVDDTLHKLPLPFSCFKDVEEVVSTIRQCLATQSTCMSYQEEWKDLWQVLDRICRTAVDSGDLWKDVNKTVGKRRALTELLKLLESSGLCRHKYKTVEVSNHLNSWFLQPSYDAQHLLLTQSRLSNRAVDVAPCEFQCLPNENFNIEWKSVNEYYFKSMASVQFLGQVALNPHKDITFEQANRSVSFLNHLIVIQQMQRSAAYGFAKHLRRFGASVSALENLFLNCHDTRSGGECSIAENQYATITCMWQQKQLFDSLSLMLIEESLLLKMVESTHSNSCQSVKPAAHRVLAFIEKNIPVFRKYKELLDNYLVGTDGVVTTVGGSFRVDVISKKMEQQLVQNFKVIDEFEEQLLAFCKQDLDKSSVIATLPNHFNDIFKRGKLMAEQFNSALVVRNEATSEFEEANCCDENYSNLEAGFGGVLKSTYEHIVDALEKLDSLNNGSLSNKSLGNITSWESLFNSPVSNLNVDNLCDKLLETIHCVEKLVNQNRRTKIPNLSFQIEAHLKHLHVILDLILSFGDGLLRDFLAMHKTVSIMTHVLANVLASLFSKGYGASTKDMVDDASHDISQDASGTGMGEGVGLNDVSDQINDEDQLLGASQKQAGEEQDASGEVPNKNDKGIEMDQDFAADAISVSAESGEDNNDNGDDEQLESAMGEAGDDSEVVDEKLLDKDEDENPKDTNEKYESGVSVKDRDSSCRELRAKEESAGADNEPGDLNSDERNERNNETRSQDDLGDTENTEDMNVEEKEAFADPTGLKIDKSNQTTDENMDITEDMDIDENEGTDSKKEAGSEEHCESAENGDIEEEMDPTDETMAEAETELVDGTSERENQDHEDNIEMNLKSGSRKDAFEPGISDFFGDQVPNAESATQPKGDSQGLDSRNISEAIWSNNSVSHNELVPPKSIPSSNTSEMDITVADSSSGGKLTDAKPKSRLPQHESSSLQKSQLNPYQNFEDALGDWKERVKVCADLPDDTKTPDEIEDKNTDADEYGYVSEFETARALGPATSEQIDTSVTGNKPDGDSLTAHRDEVTEVEIEKQNYEHPLRRASILKSKMEEQMKISDLEKPLKDVSPALSHDDGDPGCLSDSLVSIKKSYFSEDISQLSKLSVIDEGEEAQDPEDISNDMNNNATAVWRRYELLTARLSQELAEQLRLVMEPTLASKLQGDYKTGKRINMKKVIPYIASHYQKDKIWLRRTRPNKRDYQVVIAVDDSRSMSENHRGDAAINALVAVCRAISQLEMGNLAVASYGKKGNIRLLHDFDQPFTEEAGVKMISSLTFKQENTFEDEPVTELLKYLNNMLDAAVTKAQSSFRQNPLQQLVLIIGDGRFHEKKNLKPCVRDLLSKKRMVAYIILDRMEESIVDILEVLSFRRDREADFPKKYLDSFPFPYYILLRNMEALPRTLADLLRQWLELMQN